MAYFETLSFLTHGEKGAGREAGKGGRKIRTMQLSKLFAGILFG